MHELQARYCKLGANDHRHQATNEEHRKAEDQVHRADVFVVRRKQPATNALRGAVFVVMVVCVCYCSSHAYYSIPVSSCDTTDFFVYCALATFGPSSLRVSTQAW